MLAHMHVQVKKEYTQVSMKYAKCEERLLSQCIFLFLMEKGTSRGVSGFWDAGSKAWVGGSLHAGSRRFTL